eukprot:TRINITY_DN17184_c0_g1_i1.p1 TRINITY_DN17184_c0_g1~~TRINITY_DN17184_c0_g1_i1.p1  ORF type:complete len:747 (+),score=168.14 TRINITY_DN17184_c0_g1_i1:242-2482(+)
MEPAPIQGGLSEEAPNQPSPPALDPASAVDQEPQQPVTDSTVFETLKQFLRLYPEARANDKFSGSHPARIQMERFAKQLERGIPNHWKLTFSVGKGLWAAVPWVAMYNPANSSIQFGLYCVILFKTDMSGYYLTIGQGVKRMMDALSKTEVQTNLTHIIQELQPASLKALPELFSRSVSIPMDLKASKTNILGQQYQRASIVWHLYEVGQGSPEAVPPLLSHLNSCLQLVDQLNSSPEYFEINQTILAALTAQEALKRQRRTDKKRAAEEMLQPPTTRPLFTLLDSQHGDDALPQIQASKPPSTGVTRMEVEPATILATSAPSRPTSDVIRLDVAPIQHTTAPAQDGMMPPMSPPMGAGMPPIPDCEPMELEPIQLVSSEIAPPPNSASGQEKGGRICKTCKAHGALSTDNHRTGSKCPYYKCRCPRCFSAAPALCSGAAPGLAPPECEPLGTQSDRRICKLCKEHGIVSTDGHISGSKCPFYTAGFKSVASSTTGHSDRRSCTTCRAHGFVPTDNHRTGPRCPFYTAEMTAGPEGRAKLKPPRPERLHNVQCAICGKVWADIARTSWQTHQSMCRRAARERLEQDQETTEPAEMSREERIEELIEMTGCTVQQAEKVLEKTGWTQTEEQPDGGSETETDTEEQPSSQHGADPAAAGVDSTMEELVNAAMATEDAEHTLEVLRAHQTSKDQLLQGLGFNNSDPSAERREKVLEDLTREYDAKPSMRTSCAQQLLDILVETQEATLD